MRLSIGNALARAREIKLARKTGESGHWSRRQPRRGGSQVRLDEDFLRRLEQLNLQTRNVSTIGLVGEHPSHRRAASLEFADYRHYVPGDDLRRIDWNVYGRLGQLFVKLTEAKEDVALHLLLDCSESMNWGSPPKLLVAKEIVAALGYLALSRFDMVTVGAFGEALQERYPLARGKRQALSLLAFLNTMESGGETDFSASMAAYCAGNPRPGIAVVVSDFLMARGQLEGLERLAKAGLDATVIHLLHPEEIHPTLSGELELLDVESGEVVEITIGQEAIRAYEERLEAWCTAMKNDCLARGVSYVRVDTDVPIETLILKHLRQIRMVR